jgi:hypothetical protein
VGDEFSSDVAATGKDVEDIRWETRLFEQAREGDTAADGRSWIRLECDRVANGQCGGERPRSKYEGSVERRNDPDDIQGPAAGKRQPRLHRRQNLTQWSAGERGGLTELLRGAQRAREIARQTRLPHHPVLQLNLVLGQQVGRTAQHGRSNVVRRRCPGLLRIAGALHGSLYVLRSPRTYVDELPPCRRLDRCKV